MATTPSLQGALSHGVLGVKQPIIHATRNHSEAFAPDQDQSMHPPGQMVTDLALTKGLGSAVITADAKSHPESTSSEAVSETVRHSPKEGVVTGADATEEAKEPAAGVAAAPDTAESEASRTEAAANGFSTTPDTATETPCSGNSPAILPTNGGGADEEEEDDLLAAIRNRKNKASHTGQDAAKPLPSGLPGRSAVGTTHTNGEGSQRELSILDGSVNNVLVTRLGLKRPASVVGSSFLGSYDYAGRRQEYP
ncbi:uncharacterized protein P884DRAFT_4282 [Thermothelomyces heterothallicus CBS 202.75]|uniref:uncharacterized protein n=1 Tax=Thermothelomyces heterothallicus CBS 202.75 TaxID=1149848 RepID=UPI00374487C5